MIDFTEFERAKGNGEYETMVPLAEVEVVIAAMTAERDALVGAVIERAAKWFEDQSAYWSAGGNDWMRVELDEEAKRIRAIATPDHNAALEAVKAKARAEGMRKAAEIAQGCPDAHWGPWCAAAILAAAEKEAQHG